MRRSPRSLGTALLRAGAPLAAVPALLAATIAVMRFVDPPTTAFIERTRRQLRATGSDVVIVHRWVPLAQISPAMQLAAIAGEDVYFPLHRGFDWESMQTAYRHNRRATGGVRGGSTISQQVAKNLFLWPGRSYTRKAIEAALTVLIESSWPKRRILEVYLNVAQFGPSTFGVAAAARRYFDVEAAALTEQQAALLVAALPDPVRHDVTAPDESLRYRRLLVLGSMRKLPREHLEHVHRSRGRRRRRARR